MVKSFWDPLGGRIPDHVSDALTWWISQHLPGRVIKEVLATERQVDSFNCGILAFKGYLRFLSLTCTCFQDGDKLSITRLRIFNAICQHHISTAISGELKPTSESTHDTDVDTAIEPDANEDALAALVARKRLRIPSDDEGEAKLPKPPVKKRMIRQSAPRETGGILGFFKPITAEEYTEQKRRDMERMKERWEADEEKEQHAQEVAAYRHRQKETERKRVYRAKAKERNNKTEAAKPVTVSRVILKT